jgi:hypothetical protein
MAEPLQDRRGLARQQAGRRRGGSNKFFIIAQGQVEVLSKGVHGSDLRIALLTEGEFFGETDLVSDQTSDVTARTITPCVLLTLSRKDLETILKKTPTLNENSRRSSTNTWSCYPRSTSTASGTSTWSRALPRTSKSPKLLSIIPTIPANIRFLRANGGPGAHPRFGPVQRPLRPA